LPENPETECPVCLARMEPEDRGGVAWMVCANGCPTEFEAPAPTLPEPTFPEVPLRKSAAA
jgi:hypothetical protein